MANIAVLTLPAYGHVNPLLPIVAELVRHGHAVSVFGNPEFAPLVRQTGATFLAYAPGLKQSDIAASVSRGDLMRWLAVILSATAPLLGGVLATLETHKPDVLVFDGTAVWGEMAATRLRVPSVSVSTAFLFEVFAGLEGGREFLGYMWSLLKLFPQFVGAWSSMALYGIRNLPWRMPIMPRQGDLTLVLTSKAIHPRSRRFNNPRFAFVGSAIEASTRAETFDFARLDSRPLIYASLGTLHIGNTRFFDTCIQALADLPAQILLSVGRGTDLSRFAHAPANFIVADSFPQLAILARASLFITHTGLNSMHEGLWFGVPMVAVPQQFEQLRNARSIGRAGAGIVLDAETRGRPVTAAELRSAVDTVSRNPSFRERAKTLGQSLHEAGGYREAAARIEAIASLAAGPDRVLAINDAA
jgi:MGT family glycosyltransferase